MAHISKDTEESKVINLQSPDEILAKIDLEIKEDPRSYDALIESCQGVLDNSIR